MFIRVNGPPHNWQDYCIMDLDTKQLIQNVLEADDTTGEYVILIRNPETGQPLVHADGRRQMSKKLKGNIKVVHKSQVRPANSVQPHFRSN